MVDELEPGRPWSHKFQWNMGFSVDLYEFIWVASFPSLGLPLPVVEVPASGYLCYWIFHLTKTEFHHEHLWTSPTKRLNTHTHHYLEFQNGWCLAFIMKLVEQTQPKSMKSVQFHPSPPTWKQTPKNTKNNHPKHSRPKKHDEKKTASTPHQTKIPFILTQLNILQIYCGIRDTFSPRLRLNAKLLYATW